MLVQKKQKRYGPVTLKGCEVKRLLLGKMVKKNGEGEEQGFGFANGVYYQQSDSCVNPSVLSCP